MTDPYKVLGISPGASEDEIKKAYKNLSRKYHPDANVNNPNKEQAEEKFKEIQAAYQQIMNSKKNGGNGYGYGGAYNGGGYNGSGYGSYNGNPFGGGFYGGPFGGGPFSGGAYGGSSYGGNSYGGGYSSGSSSDPEAMRLNAAANYINSRHFKEALNVLSSISNRSALWYYYSAIANNGVGNNILALDHAKTAASMEPSNMQYRQLVHSLENGGSWYSTRQQPYGDVFTVNTGCCNNPCLTFLCCNALCNLCC